MTEIVKGEDRELTLSVRKSKRDGDPFDLSGWTALTVEFKKSDGEVLTKNSISGAVDVVGLPVLGKVKVSLTDEDTSQLRIGKSQTVRLLIDRASERRIALFRNALDVVNPEF